MPNLFEAEMEILPNPIPSTLRKTRRKINLMNDTPSFILLHEGYSSIPISLKSKRIHNSIQAPPYIGDQEVLNQVNNLEYVITEQILDWKLSLHKKVYEIVHTTSFHLQ